MMVRQMGVRVLVVFTALMGAVGCGVSPEELAAAQAETVGTVEQALVCNSCPGNMVGYRGQNGFQLECHCGSAGSGTVWGTGTYTDDSALCRAALHAGAIGTNGGAIVVTVTAGQNSYTGSTQNGVTSSPYGAWPGSYTVSGSSGTCTASCPGSLTGYRGQNGTVVTCACSSSAASGGGVWGTGTYTDDSALCRAAVHAGRITTAGGIISAVIGPGQSSYTGSTQNGVTSSSYGAWGGSYSF
jgi:hypothetical protein